MLNRVEQKEAKKQSLLSSAYALFTEKGVAKTSVDEIVRHDVYKRQIEYGRQFNWLHNDLSDFQ